MKTIPKKFNFYFNSTSFGCSVLVEFLKKIDWILPHRLWSLQYNRGLCTLNSLRMKMKFAEKKSSPRVTFMLTALICGTQRNKINYLSHKYSSSNILSSQCQVNQSRTYYPIDFSYLHHLRHWHIHTHGVEFKIQTKNTNHSILTAIG